MTDHQNAWGGDGKNSGKAIQNVRRAAQGWI